MAAARRLFTAPSRDEGASFNPARSFAALPPDILRSIFQLVLSPPAAVSSGHPESAAGGTRKDSAEEEAAPPGVPLRQAVRQWFALRLTCRPWAAALQGLLLPPLEIWAACPACLAWLGRPEVGVQAVRFIRRGPLHTPDESPAGGYPTRHRFHNWRQQRSVGTALSEWPRSPADEMLCRLEGVVAVGPGRAGRQPVVAPAAGWSFAGWCHLQSLSMQAPFTADSRPTAFHAPPSLCALPRLRRLELAGFAGYELDGLPSTLCLLRLTQRQAGVGSGVPNPVQLSNLLVDRSLQLELLSFELLPAAGEQLARQHGEQGSVDVSLLLLRKHCRRLDVVGPQVGLDCSCPRCAARLDVDDADSGSGTAALEGVPNQPQDRDIGDEQYYADALRHAAAQLAAPGSLLRSVTLRSTAGELDDSAEPGLLLSRCTHIRCVYEVRPVWSTSGLEKATAAVNAASSRHLAAAGGAEGSGAVLATYASDGEFPTALMLQRR